MTINTTSWESYSFIKKSAIALTIGAATGVLGYYSATYIATACASNQNGLGDYLCLRSGKFFNPITLHTLMNPVIKLSHSIKRIALPLTFFIPQISLKSDQCTELGTTLVKWINNKYTHEIAKEITLRVYEPCCTRTSSVRESLAMSFAEEFIFRFIFQGVCFAGLQKLPTLLKLRGRVRPTNVSTRSSFQKIVSHPSTRALTISLIFAFAHFRSDVVGDQVLPNFTSSLIYSSLFEKYGLLYGTFAATSAHFVSNLFAYNAWKAQCMETVSEGLSILKLLKS